MHQWPCRQGLTSSQAWLSTLELTRFSWTKPSMSETLLESKQSRLQEVQRCWNTRHVSSHTGQGMSRSELHSTSDLCYLELGQYWADSTHSWLLTECLNMSSWLYKSPDPVWISFCCICNAVMIKPVRTFTIVRRFFPGFFDPSTNCLDVKTKKFSGRNNWCSSKNCLLPSPRPCTE